VGPSQEMTAKEKTDERRAAGCTLRPHWKSKQNWRQN